MVAKPVKLPFWRRYATHMLRSGSTISPARELVLHVWLGSARFGRHIEIRCPSGAIEKLANITPDKPLRGYGRQKRVTSFRVLTQHNPSHHSTTAIILRALPRCPPKILTNQAIDF